MLAKRMRTSVFAIGNLGPRPLRLKVALVRIAFERIFGSHVHICEAIVVELTNHAQDSRIMSLVYKRIELPYNRHM